MSILVFYPFFCWVLLLLLLLDCMSSLCIFEINPLLVTLFANISPQSVGDLFFFFYVSFAVQKLISLLKSHLFVTSFKMYIYNSIQIYSTVVINVVNGFWSMLGLKFSFGEHIWFSFRVLIKCLFRSVGLVFINLVIIFIGLAIISSNIFLDPLLRILHVY